MSDPHTMPADIAVIGMAARFPDANNIDQFWQNLLQGKCSSKRYSRSALYQAGVRQEELGEGDYIGITAQIADVEYFDPAFFGFNQRDAEIMDPQFRHFFEVAWLALEDAGLSHGRENNIGIFAASGMSLYSGKKMNNYFRINVEPHAKIMAALDPVQAKILTEREYLPTQLSYRLNLTGPAYAINTACSSSLVAIHQGVQSLLAGECQAALVGASAIHAPHIAGYSHTEGSIFSADGVCRPFDAQANGITGGNGAGVVVLKKLEHAQRDGDRIYAVIKGSSINNDGAQKVSYTAPGVHGQKRNLHSVIKRSGISINQIGLIEAHGTGTLLGDPVEIGALTQTFTELGYHSGKKVTVGSVKSNIGHLDTAAGMAAFIKAVCAVHHGVKPGTANFNSLNPALTSDDNNLFTVSNIASPWEEDCSDRYALVCALGAGGTNGHLVVSGFDHEREHQAVNELEEDGYTVLCISAKSFTALEANKQAIVDFLRHSKHALTDICASQARSKVFHDFRCVVFGCSKEEMADHLTASETDYVLSGKRNRRKAKVNATPYLLDSTGKIKSAEEKDQIGAALIAGDIAPCDFFSQVKARRVPLPGYCFDRVRCWIDAPKHHEAQLPLYQHQWCPLVVNTTIDNSCLSEKVLSVGELAFQAIEIVEHMAHKQATNCLLLNDDDLDRARIVNYLLDIGSFLHQLDEALERTVTLVLLSRHSAWLEGEDTSTTADIISMIWAAMKSASHELVNIKLHWLDVSRDTSQLQLKQSLSYLVSADKVGVELVQRSNQFMHSVIVPYAESRDYTAAKIQENDAVILAGGNGGLGQYLQDYYISLGIRHLIIISRRHSEKSVNRETLVLEQQGINFYRITGDAGQKYVWHDIAQLVEERNLNVNAICHLAGVLNDAPVSSLTEENIANVISPKSDTCSRIEEMLHVLKPRSIFLYSSLSAATGSPAQFSYAAANACLDAWARKLKLKGFNVKSIQWGPWAGEGMAARVNHRANNTCRIREISASEGIKSFESIIADDTAAVYLAARLPVEDSKFTHGKSTWMELGHQLFSHKSSESVQLRTEPNDKSSQPDFGTLLTELVCEMAGLPYENVDLIKMTFSALGLDSLAMTHLRKRIASEAGVSLTIGELYSYPTILSLTEHINHKSAQDPVAGSPITMLQKRGAREVHERERLVAEICQLLR